MATIIAGLFETLTGAEKVTTALKNEAFAVRDVSVFALNPPGQHALNPIGGDETADPGAKDAHLGAASGAIVGGAAALGVGAAAMAATGAGPAVAIAAAAAGAYIGSLDGALNTLGNTSNDAQPAPMVARHAGIMVAVHARSKTNQDLAIALLRAHGAQLIEKADGLWRDGEWVDFDPRTPPALVEFAPPDDERISH